MLKLAGILYVISVQTIYMHFAHPTRTLADMAITHLVGLLHTSNVNPLATHLTCSRNTHIRVSPFLYSQLLICTYPACTLSSSVHTGKHSPMHKD